MFRGEYKAELGCQHLLACSVYLDAKLVRLCSLH